MKEEVTGDQKKLHNEELHKFCSASNIKSKRMCGWNTARMGRRNALIEFWSEDLKERDHLGDAGEHGRIILERILKE
jgi:hypothetical protein